MKKICLIILALIITTTLQAGMFSTVSGMTMKEVKPLSSYTIDTAGINPRVYEFVPQNDQTKLCVVVFSNADNSTSVPAMQCFKMDKNNK